MSLRSLASTGATTKNLDVDNRISRTLEGLAYCSHSNGDDSAIAMNSRIVFGEPEPVGTDTFATLVSYGAPNLADGPDLIRSNCGTRWLGRNELRSSYGRDGNNHDDETS
jgi:hypothetical protein